MPSPQAINRFTLAFHQRALQRLRADPGLASQALAVIDRWEARGMSAAGQRLRDEWRTLLGGDIQALEAAVCTDADHAATLRSMSPLGFVLDESERLGIRLQAMAP